MKFLDIKSNLGAISAACYVAFQLIANILSVKIAILPFTNLAVDGGTIIYPLTFTLRDFIHKSLGKQKARQIVVLAGLLNLIMVGLFIIVSKLTPDPSWTIQSSYEQILLPIWRITIASIVAQIISELIDTEIFSWAFKRFSDMFAVFSSNTISLIFDSVIFAFLAFYGNLSMTVIWQIVLSNIIIKMIMSALSIPFIKLVPRSANFDEI